MSTATAEIGAIPIAAPSAPPARNRIDSVDLLRGLVMVIMLLDHTRDFVHADGLIFDPTNLERTTPILFLTRWITHFCAPIFVLLAGTSAYLIAQRLPRA
ncbi:MAG TPA: heparan-alpha-glucosaminide N-acetyltransferase domain-containing protein, partial [Longimicrobium sp.]|nr:heparan-alpha-glucosaminide N-acetyltransferase domain-containing protein [Longimicrobium sp.]